MTTNEIENDNNQPAEQAAENKNKSGCGKMAAWGCGILLVLLIVGSLATYFGAKKLIGTAMENYTTTEPEVIPTVKADEGEIQTLVKRVDSYKTTVKSEKTTPSLKLTSKDINILIQNHPDWKSAKNLAYIDIVEDTITGNVSIPLDAIGDMGKGRYLSGKASFKVGFAAGRVAIYVTGVEVKGTPLPAALIQGLGSKNLAEEFNKNPENLEKTAWIEDIVIKDGTIEIVPKITQ